MNSKTIAIVVALFAIGLGICSSGQADDKAEAKDEKMAVVKSIPLKGLRLNFRERGSVKKPQAIEDGEQLAKAFTDEKLLATIKTQVNFKTQQLLLFKWAGSGQDKIEPKLNDDKDEVTFKYLRGRTRDLRGHAKLVAIQKGVKWKVE